MAEYQCGFVRGRSTIDAIHIVKQAIEKANTHNQKIHIMFIDFKKAFDTVKRRKIANIIEALDIPNKLKHMLKITTTKTRATVLTRKGETDPFVTTKGIRQGDTLSATIFTLALDYIMRNLDKTGTIRNRASQIIAYADDVTIIAKQEQKLKEILDEIIKEGKKFGLEINTKKTKIMTTSETQIRGVTYGGNTYERVKVFKYLGVTINNEGKNTSEIVEKIQAGNRAFFANIKILKSKQIKTKTKIQIYKTIIRPVITYAAETMTMTKKDENQIAIMERKIVRAIAGPDRLEDGSYQIKNNKKIEEVLEGDTIIRRIKRQRLKWLGHIWRRQENEAIKQIMGWKPASKRKVGRPRNTWLEEVEEDLKNIGIERWKEQTEDRKKWKEITHKL